MSKIIEAYTKRFGIDAAVVRFMFDGKKISPTDTPKMLEMEDGDLMDCLQNDAEESITVKVNGESHPGEPLAFKV
jgi:hypothetical protein